MRTILFLLFITISVQSFCQNKFQTRIGLSYVISNYNEHSIGFSHYLENAKSTNGPGVKITEEYFIIPSLSIATGVDILNTNVSFDGAYISNTSVEKHRHKLRLVELDIPLIVKYSQVITHSLKWFVEVGAVFRTIPYGYASVENLDGAQINSAKADLRIVDSPLAPLIGVGIDYKKPEKRMGLFFEVSYRYLIASYFYGGGKNNEWQSDNLIENKRFVSLTAGILF